MAARVWKDNPEEIGGDRTHPRIDLNAARRAAQDAMDAMRKNRLKHGRIKVSRSARLEGTWQKM